MVDLAKTRRSRGRDERVPVAANYRAALVALGQARRGPWQRYRDALGRLTVVQRDHGARGNG